VSQIPQGHRHLVDCSAHPRYVDHRRIRRSAPRSGIVIPAVFVKDFVAVNAFTDKKKTVAGGSIVRRSHSPLTVALPLCPPQASP